MNTHRRYCRRWLAVLLMAVAAGTAASDEDGIAESMLRIDAPILVCRDIAPAHKRRFRWSRVRNPLLGLR